MKTQHLLMLLALSSSTGCYAYGSAKPGRPETAIASFSRSVVRLTLRDRVALDMRNPQIIGDSVIGTDDLLKTRIAIPLTDVKKVQARDFNTGAVVMTVIFAALGAVVLIGLAVSSSLHSGSY